MKIKETRNYDLLFSDPINRPITEKRAGKIDHLRASIKKYGFLPQFPAA